jgi:hypothetical protein
MQSFWCTASASKTSGFAAKSSGSPVLQMLAMCCKVSPAPTTCMTHGIESSCIVVASAPDAPGLLDLPVEPLTTALLLSAPGRLDELSSGPAGAAAALLLQTEAPEG